MRVLRQRSPARVLVLTSFLDDDKLLPALRAGAAGYLLKNAQPQERGSRRASRPCRRGAARPGRRRAARRDPRGHRRTRTRSTGSRRREREVLVLIGHGFANKLIAGELAVAEKTVKTHVGHVLAKLGVSDRTQAAIFAVRAGLVEPSVLGPRPLAARTPPLRTLDSDERARRRPSRANHRGSHRLARRCGGPGEARRVRLQGRTPRAGSPARRPRRPFRLSEARRGTSFAGKAGSSTHPVFPDAVGSGCAPHRKRRRRPRRHRVAATQLRPDRRQRHGYPRPVKGIVTGASRGLGLALTRALPNAAGSSSSTRGTQAALERAVTGLRGVSRRSRATSPTRITAAGWSRRRASRSTCSSTTPACSARARCPRWRTIR